jgi:DNA recombination protein RmuC
MELPAIEALLAALGGLFLGYLLARLVFGYKNVVTLAQATSKADQHIARLEERLEASQLAYNREQTACHSQEEEIAELQSKILHLSENLAEVTQELRAEQERLNQTKEVEQRIADTFKAVSSEALRASNTSFLELAASTFETLKERASGDLTAKKQEIDKLVAPLKQSLEKVDVQMREIEKSRIQSFSQLNEQIQSMRTNQGELKHSTEKLVKALRRPTVRGRWGEIQLKRVVEIAGMIEHCDFTQQSTVGGDSGKLRPDMVVHLPGSRNIIVDSKVPLGGYLEALEAESDDLQREHMRHHARQVRAHLVKLSEKSYWSQFETSPEFVVLFLPGETFFSAALEQDPELIEYGVQHKVLVATPTTLIALLHSVAFGWKQDKLTKNAQEISSLGRELYDRIRTLSTHFISMKRGLDGAIDGYNKAVGSFESRVLVSARKFKDLGATAGNIEISTVDAIEKNPRPVPPGIFEEEVNFPLLSMDKDKDVL